MIKNKTLVHSVMLCRVFSGHVRGHKLAVYFKFKYDTNLVCFCVHAPLCMYEEHVTRYEFNILI